MKCLILAGGFGTRLYPLTIYKAKALLEYKGKPLLTHIVDKVPRNIDILVSCNRKFEADFHQWQENLGRQVEICVEDVWTDDQKKGAVGSLHYWINSKRIVEDLLVVAGDNYFEFDLAQFIAAYNGKNALVAVYDIGDKSKASQFGVVELDKNRLTKFEEKPVNPGSSLVATACYVLPPRIFPVLGEYCQAGEKDNLGPFIAHLVGAEEVHAYTFTELWFDMGAGESIV